MQIITEEMYLRKVMQVNGSIFTNPALTGLKNHIGDCALDQNIYHDSVHSMQKLIY